MPGYQKGGTLEPVQITPPFKYTTNEARKTWTRMIYPYAPYFFNLLREIPWTTFTCETDEYTVQCIPETPYSIFGGSSFELLNREYKNMIPQDKKLHNFVDPTGDIDVYIHTLQYTPKDETNINHDIDFIKDGDWNPCADTFTRWLLDHIVKYFKKLEHYFDTWFPDAVAWTPELERKFIDTAKADEEEIDIMHVVGPFAICRIKQMVSEDWHSRLQVVMNYTYIENDRQHLDQEHFMEFLFQRSIVHFEEGGPSDSRILPSLDLRILDVDQESDKNFDALYSRLVALNGKYPHKAINHIHRAIFLMQLASIPGIFNPSEIKTLVNDYIFAFKYLIQLNKRDIAKMIFEKCPEQFRGPIAEALCKDKTLDAEKCKFVRDVLNIVKGGKRRTRRTRRTRQTRRTR
jgi:hypothetical protein